MECAGVAAKLQQCATVVAADLQRIILFGAFNTIKVGRISEDSMTTSANDVCNHIEMFSNTKMMSIKQ